MKTSLRRDSLEKAARKEILKLDAVESPLVDDVAQFVVRFAQRHGAKVRRETLKEAAEHFKTTAKEINADRYPCESEQSAAEREAESTGYRNCAAYLEALLTPRGSEKRRTWK